MKTDIQIANEAKIVNIKEIARKLELEEDDLELYGKFKAKINRKQSQSKAKMILVTAINPTPAGEGKTTVSIGLADGMNMLGKKVCLALREPSLGPVFGVKGGACGGGYSQVIPMEDINLHFTGDLHAITCANNLLSAMLDNHLQQGNDLNIDPKRIVWRRCMDLNDRALRNIIVGLGKTTDGIVRNDGFDITAASEIMAILCLSRDLADLKERLSNILIAYTKVGEPVYAKDINAHEAMTILLKEAIKPNLVQTLEQTPAIIHGGPFANIAHGCNSVIATKTALGLADYVVTEAGFGADLGAEKFLDVKCRIAEIQPEVVVIVATIRALKYNGGVPKAELGQENVEALENGMQNLIKHIENITNVFGLNAIVAINRFAQDTEKEIEVLRKGCEKVNAEVVLSEAFLKGGSGAIELAEKVVQMCDSNNKKLKFAYELEDSVEEKIYKVATKVYGADGVVISDTAKKQIVEIIKNGYEKLPIVIAKTQYSLSDNAKLLNRPTGFKLTVREVVVRSGAGFIVVVCGDIMLMPGLPKVPAGAKMTIDTESGAVEGLF